MSSSTVAAGPSGTRLSFADLSVKIKVLAAIGVAALVALFVGLVGLRALSNASSSAQHIYRSNVAGLTAVGQIRSTLLQARVDLANQAISVDAPTDAKYATAFNEDVQAFDDSITAYRNSHPAGDPAVVADLETGWQQYVQIARTKQIPAGARNDLAAWQRTRDTEITPILAKAFQDLEVLNAAEAVDAKQSASSALSGYRSSRTTSIALLIVGMLLALGLGWVVAQAIVRSLTRVKDVCDALAGGDLTRTSGLTSRDEPGRMGQALDAAMTKLRDTVSTINRSASSLAGASEQMSGVSTQMSASAEETSVQAQTVSAAAEQISRSVDTVSTGSEEMGASIREIAQNATEAARVASEAVAITASTATTMSKLGESSAEIGNVIKVITSIAEQTNLLALNATIEAARAGDAGKGFAVVASEVKDLAQETARATEDISRRVEAIQTDTGGAVTAIDEITQVIARISDFQTTIASAVEEQTATTAEMNRSAAEASAGTNDIAQNITGVAEAARLTSQGVTESQQAANEVARMSTELSRLVSAFRY